MALLSDRDRDLLDFDALEFRHPDVRRCEIRRRFGWPVHVYEARVAELHTCPEGASYAALANRRRPRTKAQSTA